MPSRRAPANPRVFPPFRKSARYLIEKRSRGPTNTHERASLSFLKIEKGPQMVALRPLKGGVQKLLRTRYLVLRKDISNFSKLLTIVLQGALVQSYQGTFTPPAEGAHRKWPSTPNSLG